MGHINLRWGYLRQCGGFRFASLLTPKSLVQIYSTSYTPTHPALPYTTLYLLFPSCTILYHPIPFFSTLYCPAPPCTTQDHPIPSFSILYRLIPPHTTLYLPLPPCTTLYQPVRLCATLHHPIPSSPTQDQPFKVCTTLQTFQLCTPLCPPIHPASARRLMGWCPWDRSIRSMPT